MPNTFLEPFMSKPALPTLIDLEYPSEFIARHIGVSADDEALMLQTVGAASRADLMNGIVPESIRRAQPMKLPSAVGEAQALAELKQLALKNKVMRSHIGQGYYGTHTPGVILRNILENPAWYTAYTPYQAEISQGRMEALVNFQTMVCDLTGLSMANASMLDEATAAAEAMTLALRAGKSKSQVFCVDDGVLPQTLEVIQTRARPLGIEVRVCRGDQALDTASFAVLLQYPTCTGQIRDDRAWIERYKAQGGVVIMAADLLALTVLTPPRRTGRRHCCRHHTAVWHAHGERWPTRRLHGLQGRVQTLTAGSFGGCQRGCAWSTGLPPSLANPRTAYPP